MAPTLIFATYFTFFAPHEYLTEAKVVIRYASVDSTYAPVTISGTTVTVKPLPSSSDKSITTHPGASTLPKQSTTSSPGLLTGGKTSASPELYMIGDYVRSRTIIQDLGGKEFLRKIYDDRDIDWFARLPWPISLEDAWDYWNTKVRAIIDTQGDILTVSVRAFTPQNSLDVIRMIVKKAEYLVNNVTEASRRDSLERAENEIKVAQKRVANAQAALRTFRDKSGSVDPTLTATSVNETITALMKDKFELETNRNSLEGLVSADSPTRRLVDAQIEAKEKQIKALRAELTSQTHDGAISGKIAKFQELELENEFAQNMYSTAQTAYQEARVQLDKQQMYLSLVATPTMPEKPTFPRKLLDSALSFAVFSILWGMFALAVAAVRDHVDYSR